MFAKRFLFCTAGILAILMLSGCGSIKMPKLGVPGLSKPDIAPTRKWFLDPSHEFGNYKSYGFLQVTAVRYTDPINDVKTSKRSWKEKMTFRNRYKDDPVVVHHTDELIWRVMQEEMAKKGYQYTTPQEADLWVIYYGGPRPIRPMSQLRIKPHPFDKYFAENEMSPGIFFVDIIDAKQGKLLFRGWDNGTFLLSKNEVEHQEAPDPQKVIGAIEDIIEFFPSRGY